MCKKRETYRGRCVYKDSRDVCYNVACAKFGAVCLYPEEMVSPTVSAKCPRNALKIG